MITNNLQSRQTLTKILNQQIEQYETIVSENNVLSLQQRQLLNLLHQKDQKLEIYKKKLGIQENNPNFDLHLATLYLKQTIQIRNRAALKITLKLFRNNRDHSQLRNLIQLSGATQVYHSITRPIQMLKQKSLIYMQRRMRAQVAFGRALTKTINMRVQAVLTQIREHTIQQNMKMFYKGLFLVMRVQRVAYSRQKQQALLSLKNIISSFSRASSMIVLSLNNIRVSQQRQAFSRIKDIITYKEKAYYQIQYYQLKVHSRNYIFASKLSQFEHSQQRRLMVDSMWMLRSRIQVPLAALKIVRYKEALRMLNRGVINRKIKVFGSLRPTNFNLILSKLQGVMNTKASRILYTTFQQISWFSRMNYNPFQTIHHNISQKNRRYKHGLLSRCIQKCRQPTNLIKHSKFRTTIINQKQKIKQISYQFQCSITQFMTKSKDMIQLIQEDKNKSVQQVQIQREDIQELKRAQEQTTIEHQEKVVTLRNDIQYQITLKAQFEMSLQERDNEVNGLQVRMKSHLREINELKYELQRVQDGEKKSHQSVDNAVKDKYETVQRLEDSFNTLRQLKREYDGLKQSYQKLEAYNRDLLIQNALKDNEVTLSNNKIEEYEISMQLLQVQLNHLNQSNESTFSRSNQRMSTVDNSQETINRLKNQNTSITKEAIKLNEEQIQMKEIIVHLQENVQVLSNIKQTHESKIQQLLKVVEESQLIKNRDHMLQSKLNHFEQENQEIRRQLQSVEGALESTKKNFYVQVQQLSKEKEQLQQQVASTNKKNHDANGSSMEEAQALRQAIADLNREKVNLMREMTLEHDGRLRSEKHANEIQSQIVQYQEEIESLQNQLDLYVKVLKQMDEKIKKNQQ